MSPRASLGVWYILHVGYMQLEFGAWYKMKIGFPL